MSKMVIALGLLATLPACSLLGARPPDVSIREQPTQIVCDTTARPEPIDTQDTPPETVFDAEAGMWGYWFSPALYAALAENLQAMRRYMEQSRDIRAKLIRCLDEHNAGVAAAS